MMTELVLVEGVSDVQLISYYLQKVYSWEHITDNVLGIEELDHYEHIESLSKNENQLILCGVGGNGKFAHFVEVHRINELIFINDVASVMVITDRDEDTNAKIQRQINASLADISVRAGEWRCNHILDSFGQTKKIDTFLMVIPEQEKGALERVIINALKDNPEESALMKEVVWFIDSLKEELVPALQKVNQANKAAVGTFFSVRNPKNAMRSFGVFISSVDWTQSESLNELFAPFQYLGREKPVASAK